MLGAAGLLAATPLWSSDDEEHRLKVELDELSAKGWAAIDTVNAMERKALDEGHALSAALATQRTLVQSSLEDAGEALRENKLASVRERLTRARAHIDRLYKMI